MSLRDHLLFFSKSKCRIDRRDTIHADPLADPVRNVLLNCSKMDELPEQGQG